MTEPTAYGAARRFRDAHPIANLPGQGVLFEVPGDPRPSSMTAEEGEVIDRMARGLRVPEHKSACQSEGCQHGRIWHSHTNRNQPCEVPACQCGSYTPKILGSQDAE